MKILLSFFFCSFSLLVCSQNNNSYQPPVFSDNERLKKMEAAFPIIEKLFKEHAAKNHFPGMAFGIVADGKLVYSGGFGFTDVAKKIPANSKSIFRIASMSKSFTGLAILKLRDEGKLNLDDAASKYISALLKVKYLTTDAPPITIRNLLTHTAGFPEDNPWGDRQLADTDAELIKTITDGVQFSNIPGYAYEYSNLGFALLGNIITKVSGNPYQQYINENILKPLQMNSTFWEYSKVPQGALAQGYRWINNNWREEELLHDGSYGAMGGMLTSIEDFSHYITLHLSAWPPSNENKSMVLKNSSIREMHNPWQVTGFNAQFKFPNGRLCPVVSGYGYGLGWTKDCEGKIWVGHSGGLPGFGSQWRIFPEYGIGIVSFANLTYAGTGSINLKALDTLIAIAKLKPRVLPPSTILKQRKDELIKLLPDWKQAESSGIFAENFFPDNPIDSLKKQSASLYAKAGKIIRIGEIIPENNLRGSFVIEGEKSNIEVFFTLTPENPPLIQELVLKELKK